MLFFFIAVIIVIIVIVDIIIIVTVFFVGTYNNISDDHLHNLVRQAQSEHNKIGLRLLMGYVQNQGYRVQWKRVRQLLLRTDPTGVYQRWRAFIRRRQYWVPGPLALWHIDGNHKLIIAVVFCFEREFQMHNLTFHFSPRASRLLRVSMNLSYELH